MTFRLSMYYEMCHAILNLTCILQKKQVRQLFFFMMYKKKMNEFFKLYIKKAIK